MERAGFVSFVGAGPGDVGLIAAKGLDRIQDADVILYDRLVNPLLLETCGTHTSLVYCGKLPDRHLLRQEAINDLLLTYALEGKKVVRLKGGDPGVFGRVGEEIEALDKHNVTYEIIPGVTAGIGVPLYAGIPVTHRNLSTSFATVTGHNQKGTQTINWQALSEGVDTLAFYMGVKNLKEIATNLMKFGRDPNEPVKVIQWGTIGKQRTLTATLATVAEQVASENLSNPAITLVGQVAGLGSGQKSWFERQLLFQSQVLLARSSAVEGNLATRLQQLGAEVFQYPRWHVQSNSFPVQDDINEFDQILFQSHDSVNWFFDWLKEMKIDIRRIQAECFGSSFSIQQSLNEKGIQSQQLTEWKTEGKSLILGEQKPDKLDTNSTFVKTHDMKRYDQSNQTLKRMLEEDRIEVIVFPNAKSVAGVVDGALEAGMTAQQLSQIANVVCFGEASKRAAIEAGFLVSYVMPEPNFQSLFNWLIAQKEVVYK
ncbi:uroporphyrinogen-III C-methyltransferase [Alkalicoccobacillus murimartini]|uniref:uroporphyrinogen-III C-methyltransferase n=1 Tax=Alkalicoccobacillus murimartini TaxID=171685 RepID=A0ABT9YF07_9BACI|nr:uroporphyrinogen-III C-methyltransferase [Alkalicoccobacillus murimartini]MDQ0205649.1 uroporphyrinogen III methyltransferase/synthase [Alkalicoccobacillus murimartini]